MRRQRQSDFDIEFFGRILDGAPDYLDVLRLQGELLSRKGLYVEALLIDRRLVELLPDDCIVRYNLACSLAQGQFFDEAIEQLRRSLQLGYQDFEYLECDSDLDQLRHHPSYVALLEEYGVKP